MVRRSLLGARQPGDFKGRSPLPSGEFREIPGPVSGGCGQGGFILKLEVAKSAFEILAGETPGERFTQCGVASGEGVQGILQFLEAGVVIRLEHLALDNRKINFDVSWLPTVVPIVQSLLDQGEATRGMTVRTWGGHLVLGRVDADGPDPRFRLTPLGGGQYGLSLTTATAGIRSPTRAPSTSWST